MEVVIYPNAGSAARGAADLIAQVVATKPDAVLGLATGCTMEPVYDWLVQKHASEGLDFARCRVFNLDEYVGLPSDDPCSYHYFMRNRFFDLVNIDPARTHLPNGMADDLEAECLNYEKLIAASGGIDIQLLGIGLNGHLGFNEPFSAFRSRTRVQTLSHVTRVQNSGLFPSPRMVPRRAITMGVGTILEADRCLLLATGSEKAAIVAKALEGPLTAMITATSMQLHPACTVVLDDEAASCLGHLDHFQRIHPHPESAAPVGKINGLENGNGTRSTKAAPAKVSLTRRS